MEKSDKPAESSNDNKTWERIRMFKTVMLVFPFAAMGMTHSIQYTTIPDMRTRLDATTQEISFAMSLGALGGLFGGPMASIVDRFARFADLIIAITLLMIGCTYSLFPFSGYVWVLGVLDFFFSLGWGLYQASAHSVITHIWGTEGGPARFAIHFGYPVGSMLGPLIAIPFVSVSDESSMNATTVMPSDQPYVERVNLFQAVFGNSYSEISIQNSVVESKWFYDGSSIEFAYLIIGSFLALMAAIFACLQTCHARMAATNKTAKKDKEEEKPEKTFKEVLSPKEWAEGDTCFGVTIVVFVTVFFILQTATMKGSSEYLVTYAVDSGMFNEQEAALLNSVVYAAGATARALAIVVSKFIPISYMLFFEVHGQFLFGVLCLIFGTRSRLALCILAPCLGFFRELMWPSGFAWADYYIILLGVVVGITDMVAMSVNVVLISFQGYLYDNTVIESIFYTTVFFGFLMCVNMYFMAFFASRKGPRKTRLAEKAEEELEYDIDEMYTKL